MSTQIINVAPEYTLKYDSKCDELRDRTHQELINEHGRNTHIRCPCMQREYLITPQWVKSHFASQKHKCWRTEQQKQHIKTHGHCVSPEQIVDQQAKELRQYKKLYSEAITNLEKKDNKLTLLSEKFQEIEDKNIMLQKQLDEYKDQNNIEEFFECNTLEDEKLHEENLLLQQELENYQEDIIKITRERDNLKQQLFMLNKKTSKKLTTVVNTKPPFR